MFIGGISDRSFRTAINSHSRNYMNTNLSITLGKKD